MRSAGNLEPSAPARLPGWSRDLIAAVVLAVAAVGFSVRVAQPLPPIGFLVLGLPVALMFVRRRYPWVVLVCCVLCFALTCVALVLTPLTALPTGIAVFTIAVRTSRRTTLLVTLAVLAVLVPVAAAREWATTQALTILVVVMVGFFAAAGDATRTRRAYIAEITRRAMQAEQTREAEASRRVAEDRLRIARDLHDTVAHQMSVINLHAGAAGRAIDDDPAAAKTAVATVGAAARQVLGEIGELLAALRTPEDMPSRTPTPGLDEASALFDRFEASGLHVTVRSDDPLDGLPEAVSLAAYRSVQEALTNAHKHASAPRAHVWITRSEHSVRIVVTNPVDPAARAAVASGHGLTGLRERIVAVGGTLDAGREGGTFRVEVVLPAHVRSAEDAR